MRKRNSIRIGIVVSLFVASTLVPIGLTQSMAAACVQVNPTGKTIGTIKAGAVTMPIKAFNYPAGGIMEPQKTVLAAGLSKRHMPLSSTLGTSVITWHINFKGCWNKLNIFMSQKKGFVFKVTDENGKTRKYQIDQKIVIKKGKYKDSWFNLIGPRQLALFTCTGQFVNGHYDMNMVFIATPL